jgi:hypothetical protein
MNAGKVIKIIYTEKIEKKLSTESKDRSLGISFLLSWDVPVGTLTLWADFGLLIFVLRDPDVTASRALVGVDLDRRRQVSSIES